MGAKGWLGQLATLSAVSFPGAPLLPQPHSPMQQPGPRGPLILAHLYGQTLEHWRELEGECDVIGFKGDQDVGPTHGSL